MRMAWNGFVETSDGLSRVEIITEGRNFGVWIDGDFDDSINTKRDFLGSYGDKLFKTKAAYKKDESITLKQAFAEMKAYA